MLRELRWLVPISLALLPLGCARPAATEQAPATTQDQVPTDDQAAGITWSHDYEAALAQAKDESKLLMVDVFATWCTPCQQMDEDVFSRAEVGEASRDFVCVKVDGDKDPDLKDKLEVTSYPTVLFLDPDEREIGRSVAKVSHRTLLRVMEAAAKKARSAESDSD
jgi:thiol:disulfide interchange protein